VKSPMEKAGERVAQIQELFAAGLITQEQALRASMQVQDEFGAQAEAQAMTPGNVMGGAGDLGAQAAISELKRRGMEQDRQESMLRESQKQSRYLEAIAQNTGLNRIPVFG